MTVETHPLQKIISYSCLTCWCLFSVPRCPLTSCLWAIWARAALIQTWHIMRYWGCAPQWVGHEHLHPDTKWTSWRWAWEHALRTSRHAERVGHNYVSSFSSLLYLTIIFFLKSLRFYYTKSYFLLSPRKLTVWLGSLQREEFSICGPRVYTHQPLFLARNNKASLLF